MNSTQSIGPWDHVVSERTLGGLQFPPMHDPELPWARLALAIHSDNFAEHVWGPEPWIDDPNAHLIDLLSDVENWTGNFDLQEEETGYRAAALCAAFGLACLHRLVALLQSGERGLPLLEEWSRMSLASLESMQHWQTAQSKREVARKGGEARQAQDKKAASKRQVYECWKAWESDPSRYRFAAKFARDMLDKYPELESQTTIERWVRMWRKREGE